MNISPYSSRNNGYSAPWRISIHCKPDYHNEFIKQNEKQKTSLCPIRQHVIRLSQALAREQDDRRLLCGGCCRAGRAAVCRVVDAKTGDRPDRNASRPQLVLNFVSLVLSLIMLAGMFAVTGEYIRNWVTSPVASIVLAAFAAVSVMTPILVYKWQKVAHETHNRENPKNNTVAMFYLFYKNVGNAHEAGSQNGSH